MRSVESATGKVAKSKSREDCRSWEYWGLPALRLAGTRKRDLSEGFLTQYGEPREVRRQWSATKGFGRSPCTSGVGASKRAIPEYSSIAVEQSSRGNAMGAGPDRRLLQPCVVVADANQSTASDCNERPAANSRIRALTPSSGRGFPIGRLLGPSD